jgi:hypothetical protein
VSSREQTWLEEGATVGEPPRPAASGRGVGDVSGSQPGGAVSGFGDISTVKRAVQIYLIWQIAGAVAKSKKYDLGRVWESSSSKPTLE